VLDKFTKHGVALFPSEERTPYEHPKVTAAREAFKLQNSPKRKRNKKKKQEPPPDQFEPSPIALPATGKAKLHLLDTTLLSKPQQTLTLSCFSRPESFLQKLQEQLDPFPSNDKKRKTQQQIINEMIAKRKQAMSLLAQLTAADPKKKKVTKERPCNATIWRKEPTAEELKEMVEMIAGFEEDGVDYDQEAVRRAIVSDNMPRHMTLISKDLKEDHGLKREQDYSML